MTNKVWFCIGSGYYRGATAVVIAKDKRSACVMANHDPRNSKDYHGKHIKFLCGDCQLLPLKPKNKKIGILGWSSWAE